MIPGDDTSSGDDHEVDRLLRAAASKADSIDWALSADDVPDRVRAGSSGPRHRAVAAGLLVAAVIVAIFVAPIPQLHLFKHGSPATIVSGRRPFPALTCPRSRPVSSVSWVPADAHGVDGSARLVPKTTPSHAVICAYGGSRLAVLAGVKSITKGRPALASELTWLPRPERTACGGVGLGDVGGRDPTPAAYLIGLSYRQGWLWVSTAYTGDCDGASNGTFATSVAIGAETKKAYETGRWVAPSSSSCASPGSGRLGQEHAMVPGKPGSLDICYFKERARSRETQVSMSHARLMQLLELLNRQPTFTSTESCHETGNPTFYTLIFRYNIGPPVVVSVAAWLHSCD